MLSVACDDLFNWVERMDRIVPITIIDEYLDRRVPTTPVYESDLAQTIMVDVEHQVELLYQHSTAVDVKAWVQFSKKFAAYIEEVTRGTDQEISAKTVTDWILRETKSE